MRETHQKPVSLLLFMMSNDMHALIWICVTAEWNRYNLAMSWAVALIFIKVSFQLSHISCWVMEYIIFPVFMLGGKPSQVIVTTTDSWKSLNLKKLGGLSPLTCDVSSSWKYSNLVRSTLSGNCEKMSKYTVVSMVPLKKMGLMTLWPEHTDLGEI